MPARLRSTVSYLEAATCLAAPREGTPGGGARHDQSRLRGAARHRAQPHVPRRLLVLAWMTFAYFALVLPVSGSACGAAKHVSPSYRRGARVDPGPETFLAPHIARMTLLLEAGKGCVAPANAEEIATFMAEAAGVLDNGDAHADTLGDMVLIADNYYEPMLEQAVEQCAGAPSK
jgi:hypothetical protein